MENPYGSNRITKPRRSAATEARLAKAEALIREYLNYVDSFQFSSLRVAETTKTITEIVDSFRAFLAEKPQPTLDPQDAQKLEECKAKLTEIETAIREIEKKVKK